jgi:hypothetical protein
MGLARMDVYFLKKLVEFQPAERWGITARRFAQDWYIGHLEGDRVVYSEDDWVLARVELQVRGHHVPKTRDALSARLGEGS